MLPYQIGEPVRFLEYDRRHGTCLTNGTVIGVQPRDDGGYNVFHRNQDGIVDYTSVAPDGRSDYLSAGHTDRCFDCGGALDLATIGWTWRGPRDELVHVPSCDDPTGDYTMSNVVRAVTE